MIGVVGDSFCTAETVRLAREVGKGIAEKKAVLVCGGLGGVMEAACQGAKSKSGLTVGILPGFSCLDTNPYVDIPIVTGMDQARNVLIVRSSNVIIAIGGGYGTLSEIAFAIKFGVPVVGLNTWDFRKENLGSNAVIYVKTAREAVDTAWQQVQKKKN